MEHFTFSGSNGVTGDAILYEYDPCNEGDNSVSGHTVRAMRYNLTDLLYAIYSQTSTTTIIYIRLIH